MSLTRRRFLVLAGSGLLVPVNGFAASGRLRGRHSTPAPADSGGGGGSFFEVLTPQTLATDGFCQWAYNFPNAQVAALNNKIYVAYMDSAGTCGDGTHNIKALSYDYTASTNWSSPVTVASINPVSNDSHDVPSILVNPNNAKVEVYYGTITATNGANSVAHSPFYQTGTSANSISAFDAQARVPYPGGLSEVAGGYDDDGELHIVGQQSTSTQNGYAFNIGYARKATNGTWVTGENGGTTFGGNLIRDGGTQLGSYRASHGAPGCQPRLTVKGTTLHLVWNRNFSGCSSNAKDVFYVKSTDGGETWTSAAGTGSFTRTAGLTGTFDGTDFQFPSTYRVYEGDTRVGFAVTHLADGTPIVAFRSSSALLFRKWNTGTTWTASTIDATAGGAYGVDMVVNAADDILVYGRDAAGAFKEWVSTDGGANWSSTTLLALGTAASQVWPHSRIYSSLGGKERVLVSWIRTFSGAPSHYILMDRPQ